MGQKYRRDLLYSDSAGVTLFLLHNVEICRDLLNLSIR